MKEEFVMIHSTAIIDKSAQIGKNVIIEPFAYIGKNAILEDNVVIIAGLSQNELPSLYEKCEYFFEIEKQCKELLADFIIEEDTAAYDYILFDLPPAMTEEVKQIIRYCGLVYVPTMLGDFEIQGLVKVTVEIANQSAKLGGIFITMYQKQNDAEVLEEFRTALTSQLMKSIIPYSRTVRESQKAGLPIEAYFVEKKVPKNESSWKIVNAYEDLAHEIMEG